MKKNLWKKCAAVIMATTMTVSMAACGNSSEADTSAEDTTTAQAVSSDPIQIATKPMTEQYILGEMLKLVIESNTDYTVEVTKGIGGGTSNIMPAMEKGEFDLYPEYTSSGYVLVLGHDASGVSDDDIWKQLHEEYAANYNMSWVGEYGFNNTYAVVVRSDIAEKYNLTKTSDLAPVADQLIFGGNSDYIERDDGFKKVCKEYGLEFADVKDIDIGLKYEALSHKDIDVTNGYTTDAQLGADGVTALEDDKHIQVNYFCSTVVRNEALEEYPGLEDAIHLLDNCLSDSEMASLNHAVEVDGKDEAEVAKNYLIEKGIVEE